MFQKRSGHFKGQDQTKDSLRPSFESNDLTKLLELLKQVSKHECFNFGVFLSGMIRLLKNGHLNAQLIDRLSDAFSEGQLNSKFWLVEKCLELNLELKTVFACGGWFGSLFLDPRLNFKKVVSFDIDPTCQPIADELNRENLAQNWRFKATTEDIRMINYSEHTFLTTRKDGSQVAVTETPDTIINTSCEHIDSFTSWYERIPKDKLLILQSNDGIGIDGHINCSKDLTAFEEQTPMSRVLFSGEAQMPKFKRFMRIGFK